MRGNSAANASESDTSVTFDCLADTDIFCVWKMEKKAQVVGPVNRQICRCGSVRLIQ